MLYVGNNEMGAFALLKLSRKMDHIKYEDFPVEPGAKLGDYVDELISDPKDLYIVDITSFSDSEEEIVNAVDRICRGVNSDVIIYAPDMDPQSTILISFKAIGYSKIITQMVNQTQLLQELLTAIEQPKVSPENVQEELIEQRNDEYDEAYESNPVLAAIDERMSLTDIDFQIPSMANVAMEGASGGTTFEPEKEKTENADVAKPHPVTEIRSDVSDPVKAITVMKPKLQMRTPNPIPRNGMRTIKIAVIGSMRRIGTTTVALQLVKHLNDQEEHAAAYLQYNNSDFITDLKEICCADQDTGKPDKITFANTDIFSDPRKVSGIISSGYQYIVYDYGDIKSISQSSAFEKDIIIIVGGGEPDEIRAMTAAMEVFNQKNVFYFFNFTPFSDREELLDMMEGYRNKTFFLDYIPDKFCYNPDLGGAFARMMESDYEVEDLTTGKEKRLGRIFRK
nr:hypothetical protein [uncultured Blautia sp.]